MIKTLSAKLLFLVSLSLLTNLAHVAFADEDGVSITEDGGLSVWAAADIPAALVVFLGEDILDPAGLDTWQTVATAAFFPMQRIAVTSWFAATPAV